MTQYIYNKENESGTNNINQNQTRTTNSSYNLFLFKINNLQQSDKKS